MKKLFTILALGAGIICANAQSVKGNKFADNWTLGISGGVITPTTNHAFFGSMRPTITLEASKWFTPVYALAVQGQTGFNYDKIGYMMPASEFGKSKTAFDAAQVMLLNKFNLSNLFGGYKGEPRLFEVEAYFGAGYTHFYMNGGKDNGIDGFSSKTGLNFNFNLGSAKAWQFNIKPAITWILDANKYAHPMNYNVNRSAVELTAGVTYKFATSNGTHNFALVKEYDVLVLGTSTWGAGELQDDWYDGVKVLKKADLSHKFVALFGCGDSDSYSDTFCDGIGILYEDLKDTGCTFIGITDTAGYTFDASVAVVNGKFVGLPIDEVNEDSQTDQRIDQWVEGLKKEIN